MPVAKLKRITHMKKNANAKPLLALLIAASLTGCATPSKPTLQVVAPRMELTPLPESVKTIDSSDSQDYLKRVSDWLSKVGALLNAETPK